jgi:hypothetical protein
MSVNQLEVLFKKYSGVVDANPGSSIAQEPGVSAKSYVTANRILSQPIPLTAPTDLVTDATFTNGIRKTSSAYPYIVKYENVSLHCHINLISALLLIHMIVQFAY